MPKTLIEEIQHDLSIAHQLVKARAEGSVLSVNAEIQAAATLALAVGAERRDREERERAIARKKRNSIVF